MKAAKLIQFEDRLAALPLHQIERLRDAWFEAPGLAERQRICRAIQEQAWQDAPFIPLGQWKTQSARRTSVVDLPSGIRLFWGARPS